MMNPVPWLQMTNMISYQGLVRTFPKDFGLAHMKVKLFGSDKVASLISEAVYTDDEARKNEILEKDMIDAMKDDLRSKRT